jgi:hypothetical protein
VEGRKWEESKILGGHWVGSSSLAIQYWKVYDVANEQNYTISELWDGKDHRVTSRRCFDHIHALVV